MHKTYKLTLVFTLLLFMMANLIIVMAQPIPTPVKCGEIIEGEVTQTQNYQPYTLPLVPGDSLNLQVIPVGGTFAGQLAVYNSANQLLGNNWNTQPAVPVSLDVTLSSTDNYRINVHGPNLQVYGAYTLYIGCTLKNGTVIKPGDTSTGGGTTATATSPTTAFSGNGFPGLSPVDFSSAFILPLNLGQMNNGQIPAAGNAVLAFTFTGNAGQKADFLYKRPSGNLNLGIVVLSPSGKVVFQSSLISTDSLNANFVLPESGQYTIGVFKIDLVPPAAPEATAFQLQVSLT